MVDEEVDLFLGKSSDDVLIDDGSTSLQLIRDPHVGQGVFGLSMVDGGGFTGLLVTVAEWEAMKQKVDAFVASMKQ